MKGKRYLFALKFKNGKVKRFFITTDDPFAKTREYYRRYESVDDVTFRQMR